MPNKTFLTWEDMEQSVDNINSKLTKLNFKPDVLICVGRGGMIPTRLLSDYYLSSEVIFLPYRTYEVGGYSQTKVDPYISISMIESIINFKNILLVDDISDSGNTLVRCKKMLQLRATATLKEISIITCTTISKTIWIPDAAGIILENENWIVFPWEKKEFK
jgi:hypoxanthine phosphoribosyltransferase